MAAGSFPAGIEGGGSSMICLLRIPKTDRRRVALLSWIPGGVATERAVALFSSSPSVTLRGMAGLSLEVGELFLETSIDSNFAEVPLAFAISRLAR